MKLRCLNLVVGAAAAVAILVDGVGARVAAKLPRSMAKARELKERSRLKRDFMKAMAGGGETERKLKSVRPRLTQEERLARFKRKIAGGARKLDQYAQQYQAYNQYQGYNNNNGNNGYNQQQQQQDGQQQQDQQQYDYQEDGNMDGEYYEYDEYNNGNDGMQYAEYDAQMLGFEMANYAFKYSGCAAIKTYEQDNAYNYQEPMDVQTYVVFRLCPADSCNKYSMTGCGKDYGEYLVEMSTYLEAITQYYDEKYDDYCEYCMPCDWEEQEEREAWLEECYQEWEQEQEADAWQAYYEANNGDMSGYTGGWGQSGGNNGYMGNYNGVNANNVNANNNANYANANNANNAYGGNNAYAANAQAYYGGGNNGGGNNGYNAAYNGGGNNGYNNGGGNNGYNNGNNRKLNWYGYGGNNGGGNNRYSGNNGNRYGGGSQYSYGAGGNQRNSYYNYQGGNQYNGNQFNNGDQYMESDADDWYAQQYQMQQAAGYGFYDEDGAWQEVDASRPGYWGADGQYYYYEEEDEYVDKCQEQLEQMDQCDDYICGDYVTFCTDWYGNAEDQQAQGMAGVDLREFVSCTEYTNAFGQTYFIAPHCGQNHFTISLGVFSDEQCTNYIGRDVSISTVLGYDVNEDDFVYFPKDCISCDGAEEYQQKQNQENDSGRYGNYVNQPSGTNKVVAMCMALFAESAQCNRNIEGYGPAGLDYYFQGGYNGYDQAYDQANYAYEYDYYDQDEANEQQEQDQNEQDAYEYEYDYDYEMNNGGNYYENFVQNEEQSCAFIDNILYGTYDEFGEIILDDTFDFSDWKNAAQYRKLRLAPGQIVGLAVSLLLVVALTAAALIMQRNVSRKEAPWRPKRSNSFGNGSISRQNSGIVLGRSRSGPGAAPII